jgi:hypothetical protein
MSVVAAETMDDTGHPGIEVLYLDNARQWAPFFAQHIKFVENPIPEDPTVANLPEYTIPEPKEVWRTFCNACSSSHHCGMVPRLRLLPATAVDSEVKNLGVFACCPQVLVFDRSSRQAAARCIASMHQSLVEADNSTCRVIGLDAEWPLVDGQSGKVCEVFVYS